MTFFDGSTQLGSAPVDGFGNAALPMTFTAGTHSITAKYAGDTNYLPSTSPAFNLTVNNGLTPTVTVTVSPHPTVGQPLGIVALISFPSRSPTPTGTVTFKTVALTGGISTAIAPVGVIPTGTVLPSSAVGAHSHQSVRVEFRCTSAVRKR